MKKLASALIGGANADRPAKKATVYAIFATTAVLIVTVLTLIISSVIFSLTKEDEVNVPGGNNDSEGGAAATVTLEYTTVTAVELSNKTSGSVNVKDNRTEFGTAGNVYYASYANVMLSKSAQTAVDEMLIAFYNANKTSIITAYEPNDDDCNVPLIQSSDGENSFVLNGYDEKTSAGVPLYSWIYTNAYKYGFIYEGNNFRYVGEAVSTYMKNSNITSYSAFITAISGASANVSIRVNNVAYQIYYLAKDAELKVPTNYEYTVIKDGSAGYIITVNTSNKIS